MKKNLNFILFLLLALSSFLSIWYFQSERVRNQDITNQLRFKYDQLLKESEKIRWYFVYQNQILSKSITNTILQNFNVSGNIDNYLVACFTKQNCGICMKRLIVDLDDFKKKTGFTKIFLSGDIPENEFYSMMGIKKTDYDYVFIPEFSESFKEYKTYPLLFVINSTGEVQHLFIPDILKDYNEIYFEKIVTDLVLK